MKGTFKNIIYALIFISVFALTNLSSVNAAVDIEILYKQHNDERLKRNLPPLSKNSKLVESAADKANVMMATNCWDHYCPAEVSFGYYLDKHGYNYSAAGENLAKNFNDTTTLMSAWMNSQSHRENVLNPKFKEIGIASATGNFKNIKNNQVIVVHFGTEMTKQDSEVITVKNKNHEKTFNLNYPSDGDFFKDNKFKIKGAANNISKMDIKVNDKFVKSMSINKEFEIDASSIGIEEDGKYKIELVYESQSTAVNIVIDSIPPDLNENDFVVVKENENYILSTTSDDIAALKIDENAQLFAKTGKIWSLFIDPKLLSNDFIDITAYDVAGNFVTVRLDVDKLLDRKDEGQVLSYKDMDSLNLVLKNTFILSLGLFFVLNFFVLKRTGQTANHATNWPLTLIFFLMLIVLLIIGSNNGQIL